jgi:hypothetical protein
VDPVVGIPESAWSVFLAARDRAIKSRTTQASNPATLWAHLVCVVMMRDDVSMMDFNLAMCRAVFARYPDFLKANTPPPIPPPSKEPRQ